MNIYKVSQSVNQGYDTYDSFIVIAENEEQARSIYPTGENIDKMNDKTFIRFEWCEKEYVKIELIGEALDGLSGVVCASYNAG